MSFLFGSSVIDEQIEKATSETLPIGQEDLALNFEIADKIKSKAYPPKQVIKALKSRIIHKNPNVQILALKLTDICVKNSGHHFLLQIASEDFTDTLVGLVRSSNVTHIDVRKEILNVLQIWGLGFREKSDLSYLTRSYYSLKDEGYTFPTIKENIDTKVLIETKTAPEWSDSDACSRCRMGFSAFNRKHHCRNCGECFCGPCSSNNIPLPSLGIEETVRVCDGCFSILESKSNKIQSLDDPLKKQNSKNQLYNDVLKNQAFNDPLKGNSKEDDDLARAIAASLQQTTIKSPKTKSKPSPPVKNEEEDDEDIRAAIAASLEEDRIRKIQRENALNEEKTKRTIIHHEIKSEPTRQQSEIVKPSYELDPTECENIYLFSQLIDQVGQQMELYGPDRVDFRQLNKSFTAAQAIQPTLTSKLNQVTAKNNEYLALSQRLSEVSKLYDDYLNLRLYGAPLPNHMAYQTPNNLHNIAPQLTNVSVYHPQGNIPIQSAGPGVNFMPEVGYQPSIHNAPPMDPNSTFINYPIQQTPNYPIPSNTQNLVYQGGQQPQVYPHSHSSYYDPTNSGHVQLLNPQSRQPTGYTPNAPQFPTIPHTQPEPVEDAPLIEL